MKIVAVYNCIFLGLGVGLYFAALITHSSLVQLLIGAIVMSISMVIFIATGERLFAITKRRV